MSTLPDIPYYGPRWFEVTLRVRGPWPPADGDNHVRVEADVIIGVKASGPPGAEVQAEVRQLADKQFREMGLGQLMDLEGARVTMELMLV